MKALKKAVSVVLSLVIVFSVFTIVPFTASAEAETYVDTIDGDMLAKNVQGYYEWEDVKKGDYSGILSTAVYNGSTSYEMKNDISTFKLKKSDGSIYTTESGGNVKNITATWVNNKADRTLLIYGKDTPYTSYSDLYSEDSRGELIGSLAFTTTGDETLSCTINGNYPYIGFAVDSATIYLEELKIEWTTGCVAHNWETQWSWTPKDGEVPRINNTSAVMTATCTACGEMQTVNGVVEQTGYSEATCVSGETSATPPPPRLREKPTAAQTTTLCRSQVITFLTLNRPLRNTRTASISTARRHTTNAPYVIKNLRTKAPKPNLKAFRLCRISHLK